jgi:hypothetical protein
VPKPASRGFSAMARRIRALASSDKLRRCARAFGKLAL